MRGEIYRGANLDEALSAACAELQARVGELRYEVETSDGNGTAVRAELDPVAVVGLFLSETFAAGRLEVQAHLVERDEILEGELAGTDAGVLTAGGGRGLDALQYLCNRVLRRRTREHPPVHLDADGFKMRRGAEMRSVAEDAADEAVRRERGVTLGPYTPAVRREIHLTLADDPRVETESDGAGFLKRVVVRPVRGR